MKSNTAPGLRLGRISGGVGAIFMADQAGTVTLSFGVAYAQSNDGIRELVPGSPIYCDDVITTGTDSSLEIRFLDDAVLAQGENSTVLLNEYLYDPGNEDGEFSVELLEGTLRSVTGKIVDMNPEGFSLNTNMTTVGIRGTTTGHVVLPDGSESHVVLDFVDKPVVFTSKATGQIRVISQDGFKVTSASSGISYPMKASSQEIHFLERLSPGNIDKEDFYEGAEGDDLLHGDASELVDTPDDGSGKPIAHHDENRHVMEGDEVSPLPEEGLFGPLRYMGMHFPLESSEGGSELNHFPFWTQGADSRSDLLDIDSLSSSTNITVSTEDVLDLSEESTAMGVQLFGSGGVYYEELDSPDTGVTVVGNYESAEGTEFDDVLFGDSDVNKLDGNAGADKLFGLAGADTLSGGGGADTFAYVSPDNGGDLLLDFSHADDVLSFSLNQFSGGGDFVVGVNTASVCETNSISYIEDGASGIDSNDHFVYYNDGETFSLYYDENGSNAGGHTLIASFVVDVSLDASDIEMVG